VDALKNGHVDIAWNTPLAHARYHLSCDGKSQTLVMRDVDCKFRCKLLVRKESGIKDPAGLEGKRLALGSREAAEATVLPLHYLKGEGVKLDKVKVLHLDEELDLRGNPCSSPLHVLKTLRGGRADAGFVGERLWDELVARKAPEVEGLLAVWTSPSFSHCVFTAAEDFDKTRAARFTQLMLAMDGKDEGTAEILRFGGCEQMGRRQSRRLRDTNRGAPRGKRQGNGRRSSLTPTGSGSGGSHRRMAPGFRTSPLPYTG